MPGMRLFGRRCTLATDDFILIGFLDCFAFLPWLAWTPAIYVSYIKHRSECALVQNTALLDASLPGLCVLFFLNWILGALSLIFSLKGTISEPEPRRHVVTIVYLKLIVGIFDVAWAILGTIVLARNNFCDIIGLSLLIEVCTIFQWIITFVRCFAIFTCYDWNFSKHTKDGVTKEYFTTPVRKGTFKKWNLRLQTLFLWCTTPSEARKQALETASELMALLSCDLDLVASDVIAGLLLYRQKCCRKWKSEKESIKLAPPIVSADGEKLEEFPPPSFQPWMNLQLASRYMNLGLGVFGWAWFVYRNITCGFCLLFKRLTCCFPCRETSKIVFGDNCCGCNLAGLQATTELEYEDLVHVSFVDKVFEVPFFVTYDHQTKAVIVAARGTMSMNDVLTDVAAAFACMDDPGCPPGTLCHGGMLSAAREIKRKLEEHGILDRAFEDHPDYDLVITGHSLGASVSSILTLLLKQKYPKVRCFAFAPSPTLNKAALPFTFQNIFTVIYGNDSVCYLNYENIKTMVLEMVKCLKECKLPKYKVFLAKDYQEDVDTEEKHCRSEIDEKNYGTNLSDGENGEPFMKIDLEKGCEFPVVTESVYVVGTIVHIWKTDEGYRLKIRRADDYKPLSFRPKSILDHFPQYLQASLNQLGKTPTLSASSMPKPLSKV
ncbi:diacylglycerol lipase-beta-like [Argiope bruennichi]|uniref:sn-1-specific diacylglycerol lipase n=1 Tax=Argiope bruennichi TaxID=94029 RepID=A0A8T0FS27_ARGBR|nr:diacylglycerol lipase-beta-like [Argiope bruennichi]XP_055954227.1 diacylglycerol lipase-beta-like [Argiope bruennichi]XP_055954228.1 diacylglycerol lipase-beta-like [Argiope bruennichi]KAF8793881.1 Sn1-specific diacylglycerol lipase beta like protein [Argiope bruennichi]